MKNQTTRTKKEVSTTIQKEPTKAIVKLNSKIGKKTTGLLVNNGVVLVEFSRS